MTALLVTVYACWTLALVDILREEPLVAPAKAVKR